MRRDFVANVSHEIRTPLTVLAGFVETMSELPLTEVERKRVLALMAQQTQRMQTLVGDLLTLAQLEGSPRPPADRWVARGRAAGSRRRPMRTALSAGRHELRLRRRRRRADRRQRGRAAQRHRATWSTTPCATRRRAGASTCAGAGATTAAGELRGQRHRHRHRARAPAAADRALLPRRRQPLARHRRHRAGPVDRQARGAAPRRRARHPERAGQGLDASGWCCRRRACAVPRRWRSRERRRRGRRRR